MKTFNLLIITPEAILYQDDILAVILPGKEGVFEVLSHHAPIIAMVKAGKVTVTDKNKQKHDVAIPEGIFEFYQNKGVLLSMPATIAS